VQKKKAALMASARPPKPFTFLTERRAERKAPLLYMDVNLGPGKTGRIGLHEVDIHLSVHLYMYIYPSIKPFTFLTERRAERKAPLLYMDVNLGPGKTGRIGLHEVHIHYIFLYIYPCIYLSIHPSIYLAILRLSIYLHIMYQGAAAET